MQKKSKSRWSTATGRTAEGRQVKCLTADDGHLWMPTYDDLPPVVRRRLAASAFNLCAACMVIETEKVVQRPTIADYLTTIARIERELRRR